MVHGLAGLSAFAQQPNGVCTYLCDPPPVWTNGTATFDLTNGTCENTVPQTCCRVTVAYRYYKTCGNDQLLEITRIVFMNQYCNWFGFNGTWTLRRAAELLLISNPMGFIPNATNGGCIVNTQVMTGNCWYKTGNRPYNYDEWLPCNTEGITCCGATYQVCYDPNTQTRTVTVMGIHDLSSTCPNPPGQLGECQMSCPWGDWMKDGTEEGGGQKTDGVEGDRPSHK